MSVESEGKSCAKKYIIEEESAATPGQIYEALTSMSHGNNKSDGDYYDNANRGAELLFEKQPDIIKKLADNL